MQLPFFYTTTVKAIDELITLDEETSRHVVSVLRMKPGEELHLTDGNGNIATATIVNDHKKRCEVEVKSHSFQKRSSRSVTIAVSLLKNQSRFEWFLEKATEIGVSDIIPLICSRTERQHFRKERMEGVLISAMLQSRQSWLPRLTDPVPALNFFKTDFQNTASFIAHCDEQHKETLLSQNIAGDALIAIGPEGDFSTEEISLALEQRFVPVSLGETRLRSETAAIVAATLLCIGKGEK